MQVSSRLLPRHQSRSRIVFFVTLEAESETDCRHGCVRNRIRGQTAKSEIGGAIYEASIFHAKCDGLGESIVRSGAVLESAFGLGTGSGEGIELIPVWNEKERSTSDKNVRTAFANAGEKEGSGPCCP